MGLYRGYIGIMEKKMETTVMENQMEKNMENEMKYIGVILGLYRGYFGNGKENGNYAITLGIY